MIILISGPPYVGKDTAANHIINLMGRDLVRHIKMSAPLKNGIREMFKFSVKQMKVLEKRKDTAVLTPISFRQMQIRLSVHMKQEYGDKIFGEIFVRTAQNSAAKNIVVSDCGFNSEIDPIIRAYKPSQIGLIKVNRPGCDYSFDSREPILEMPFQHVAHIDNNYDLELYHAQVRRVLEKWHLLEKKPIE